VDAPLKSAETTLARPRARVAVAAPDAVERLEIALLLEALHYRHGYDFRGYALPFLARRVRRRVQEEGVRTISGLQEKVLRDPAAMGRLSLGLSVPTTSMFRDPGFYRGLRERVLPVLRTYPVIRIWHAGCSSGEEVYSLAILLVEEGLYGRSRIYATDVQPTLLQRASQGVVELEAARRWEEPYRAAGGRHALDRYYTAQGPRAVLAPELRANVMFAQHNLVTDASFNEFNLILCRNVLMYFDAPLQQRAHGLLCDSLVRFGFLGLGRRETVGGHEAERRYALLDLREKLYRKVA
jgi:chemotaxis protein methyltransferase CheR